jgi:hypothetical protein
LWFSVVEKLALGDITKFDDVYKQNYILALNLLAYWRLRDKEWEKQQRKEELKNKLKY